MKPIVIFDLDGVLIDSIPAHYETFRLLFREYGIRYSFREFITSDITAGAMNVIPRVMRKHRKHANLNEAMDEKNYIIKKEKIPLNPGVKKLLSALKKNGYRIAVGSGGPRPFVMNIIKKHRIAGYFEVVVTGSDNVRPKPFPDIYRKVAKKMRVSPHNCIVIEDSHDGVVAAHRAGMKCIGHKVRIEKQDLTNADAVVRSMTKVNIKMIEKIMRK
jgi:HAD superfamily hydrolase (TIGR01509 family)